jgi:hypothetical protein
MRTNRDWGLGIGDWVSISAQKICGIYGNGTQPIPSRTPNPQPPIPNPSQRGGFSPFLFGLILGMGVFSALSMQWAKQALTHYQEEQVKRAKENATDVAKGMNFAILTENQQTYSDNYDLDRARKYSNSSGRTQGGQDFMVTSREDENRESFGQKASTIAVTGSDDTLLRSQMHRMETAKQILNEKTGNNQAVAVYDTSMARDRQIRTSNERMETLAEQVYAFYAARHRFPTDSEFTTLQGTFSVRDVWGNDFVYKQDPSGQKGILSFTTPWNYTQSLNLSLKDETDPANNPQ